VPNLRPRGRHADSDINSHVHADTANRVAFSFADTNLHPECDANADSNQDIDRDPDRHQDADLDANTHTDANFHFDCHRHADRDADADAKPYAHRLRPGVIFGHLFAETFGQVFKRTT
jgi:hypothetical protein